MPIGVDNFKEVREQYYFVDKTDFIRQLIDAHSKVTLITRPRRFGKTLTMSMLEYFFSIDRVKESDKLFHGLAIEKAGTEYMKHYGQWGIFLRRLYLRYNYLCASADIDDGMKEDFFRITKREATENELAGSLTRLMEIMQAYYGKPVILLIDEYDAPIQSAWEDGFYEGLHLVYATIFRQRFKDKCVVRFCCINGSASYCQRKYFQWPE